MGNIVQYSKLSGQNIQGLMRPLIFCNPAYCNQANMFDINRVLAEKLMKIKPERRSIRLEMCFNQILSELPDDVIVKNFDVMFNPNYKVDVLQILIAANRKKSFSVLWPGKLSAGKLIYAEDGYADYKEFDVNNYDITCVI